MVECIMIMRNDWMCLIYLHYIIDATEVTWLLFTICYMHGKYDIDYSNVFFSTITHTGACHMLKLFKSLSLWKRILGDIFTWRVASTATPCIRMLKLKIISLTFIHQLYCIMHVTTGSLNLYWSGVTGYWSYL